MADNTPRFAATPSCEYRLVRFEIDPSGGVAAEVEEYSTTWDEARLVGATRLVGRLRGAVRP